MTLDKARYTDEKIKEMERKISKKSKGENERVVHKGISLLTTT